MIDINKLYGIYVDENISIDKEKGQSLERFRDVESNYKYYEDMLNILEKEKNKSRIDSYQKLSEELINKLKVFDPRDIKINLGPVQNEIDYLIEIRDDVSSISQKFKHTETMWNSFIERNETLDLSSIFIKNIFDEIKKTKAEFKDIDLNNLSRIEENIIDLHHSIERSVSMIENLSGLMDDNDFIGKEPLMLKKTIEDFIEIHYKEMTLLEINDFFKETETKINFYRRKVLLKRVKAKVIKIMNEDDITIYNYGIELNGFLLYTSEKLSRKELLEDTKEFLYIDNFPVYGIVPLKTIQDDIEVADDQFYANKELNDTSLSLFVIALIASGLVVSMTLFGTTSPMITIPLIAAIVGAFIFMFKGLKYNVNSKYNLPNMFYFFKVSYLFVKIGDDGLNVQAVIPRILENFTKIVSHDASIKLELNKRRLDRRKEEESGVANDLDSKGNFFSNLFKKKRVERRTRNRRKDKKEV